MCGEHHVWRQEDLATGSSHLRPVSFRDLFTLNLSVQSLMLLRTTAGFLHVCTCLYVSIQSYIVCVCICRCVCMYMCVQLHMFMWVHVQVCVCMWRS